MSERFVINCSPVGDKDFRPEIRKALEQTGCIYELKNLSLLDLQQSFSNKLSIDRGIPEWILQTPHQATEVFVEPDNIKISRSNEMFLNGKLKAFRDFYRKRSLKIIPFWAHAAIWTQLDLLHQEEKSEPLIEDFFILSSTMVSDDYIGVGRKRYKDPLQLTKVSSLPNEYVFMGAIGAPAEEVF